VTSTNLTDPDLYLGTVVAVTPTSVLVNLPFAAAASMRRVLGRRRIGGLVGDFVCVDAEGWVLVGRLDEARLPERDRAMVDPRRRADEGVDPHPIGRVALLAAVHTSSGDVVTGVERPPRLGARAYLAPLEVVELVCSRVADGVGKIGIRLGTQPHAHSSEVTFSPRTVFDRHCAIVGATGGGKSWTTARLIEEVIAAGGKCVLLDPTGEYRPPSAVTTRVRLGVPDSATAAAEPVAFPHWLMSNEDLFSLFTPAGQMQTPLLREAIASLRLLAAMGTPPMPGITIEDGCLVKDHQKKRAVTEAIRAHRAEVERVRGAYFDIDLLVRQLRNECVWPSDFNDPSIWGGRDDRSLGFVVALVLRIESFLSDERYSCVFRQGPEERSLIDVFDQFLLDGDTRLLHVDLSTTPPERHFKQIVVNALARLLLERARLGEFKARPLILFVDEAHQFLGRVAHLDDFGLALDGIELIAKEGRKYGLHLALATQRPRDLTRQVMSQVGFVLVHRLTEAEDLEILGHTAGRRDAGAVAYVPGLSRGQCLAYGAELAFPIIVQVYAPASPPDSFGSDFENAWK
jgi:hypothetical protein